MGDIDKREKKVLIVGAGVFGVSTAYHLLKRGFKDITVVDRADTLPALDAASTDLNKIVRSAYEDPFYCHLAREAIVEWKNDEIWGDSYHESGFVILSLDESPYGDASLRNDLAAGARVKRIDDREEIAGVFPSQVQLGKAVRSPVLHNLDGGWADAADGVRRCTDQVKKLGGKVVPGKTAKGVTREEGRVTGVIFEDESSISADIVVLAAGSWTASSFPELELDKHVFASGQGLATIQLSQEEAERYHNVPVVLDHSSGFYIFPPNKDNVVKFSAHGAGYTHVSENTFHSVSTPRTLLSHGEDGLRIPKEMVLHFREILATIYPELAKKDFVNTRLCWYTYTSDSDWVIDALESDENLFIATGGSGHAYKFLPVLGRLVADRIEGNLSSELTEKFSSKRNRGPFKNWGWFHEPRPLSKEELCTSQDLLA